MNKERLVSLAYGFGGAFLCAFLWYAYILHSQHVAMWTYMTQPKQQQVSPAVEKAVDKVMTPTPSPSPKP